MAVVIEGPDAAPGDATNWDASGADTTQRDATDEDGPVILDALSAHDTAAPDSSETWPPGPVLDRTINFQPPGNPPSGAEADTGAVYGLQGYGWSTDLSSATDRADLRPGEPLLDTFVAAGAAGRVDTWELMVPEARYLVTVAMGNPSQATGPLRLVVEGEPVVDGLNSLRNEFLWVVDRVVGVRDGRLTLQLGNGVNPSTLNFVRVRSLEPAGGCAARTEVCNGLDEDCNSQPDDNAVCSAVPTCYSSTLADSASVATAGFSQRGGSFVSGGLQIDGVGARLERTLQGNFAQGHIGFEVRNLLWQRPSEPNATACTRTVFELNHGGGQDPLHGRLILWSVAPGCGNQTGGVLRLSLPGAFCCLDSPSLASVDDDQWHSVQVVWTGQRVSLWLDQVEVANHDARFPSVGRDPLLWLGSAGGSGDVTGASFRNLEVCNTPP